MDKQEFVDRCLLKMLGNGWGPEYAKSNPRQLEQLAEDLGDCWAATRVSATGEDRPRSGWTLPEFGGHERNGIWIRVNREWVHRIPQRRSDGNYHWGPCDGRGEGYWPGDRLQWAVEPPAP
jgi:hypothetical protein